MKDHILCVPIPVISGVGAVFTAAVTSTQLALQFITLSMLSVIVTGPLLLADVIVTILLFVGIRWHRPKLVLPILFVTVVNIVLMLIQFVFAVWALSSNDSPLAQAVMGRLNFYYPWIYGSDEEWQIENTQLEVHGIAQGLTTEFAILIPLSVLFFIAHVWTYTIVGERLRLIACGGHAAPTVHVIPSAYACPSPLASPPDTKPPSYSLAVENSTIRPQGNVEKVKY